jgi:hypothetical protein
MLDAIKNSKNRSLKQKIPSQSGTGEKSRGTTLLDRTLAILSLTNGLL